METKLICSIDLLSILIYIWPQFHYWEWKVCVFCDSNCYYLVLQYLITSWRICNEVSSIVLQSTHSKYLFLLNNLLLNTKWTSGRASKALHNDTHHMPELAKTQTLQGVFCEQHAYFHIQDFIYTYLVLLLLATTGAKVPWSKSMFGIRIVYSTLSKLFWAPVTVYHYVHFVQTFVSYINITIISISV